jgi:hypothetical protein
MSNHDLKTTRNTRVEILPRDECLHYYVNNLTRKNKTRYKLRKGNVLQDRQGRDVGFPISPCTRGTNEQETAVREPVGPLS